MTRNRRGRAAWLVALAALAAAAGAAPARASEEWERLKREAAVSALGADQAAAVEAASRAVESARRDQHVEEQAESLRMLVSAQARAGRAADAERTIAALDALQPRSASVLYQLGRAYEAAGDASRAEAALREAARRAPDDQRPPASLAALLRKQRRYQEAAQMLEQAVAKARDKYGLYLGLAHLYRLLGDNDKARRTQDLARALPPAEAAKYVYQAYWSLGPGDDAEARSLFEDMAAAEPANAYAQHHLGKIELKAGRYGAAEKRFESALAMLKADAIASREDRLHTAWHLGLARAAALKPAEAEEAYREAEALGGAEQRGRLSWALLRDSWAQLFAASDPAKAESLYRDALAQCGRAASCSLSGRAVLLSGLAAVLAERGQGAEAEAERQRAAFAVTRGAGYGIRLLKAMSEGADRLAARGDDAQARALYEAVLAVAFFEQWPYRLYVVSALRRLGELARKRGETSVALEYARDALALLERRSGYVSWPEREKKAETAAVRRLLKELGAEPR